MSYPKIPKRLRRNREPVWTPFEPASPANPLGEGTCMVNSLYQVSIHEHASGWTWLAIVRRDRSHVHDWRHLQRIKNEICGPEREAVELYPAESRLVDTSNQFHLWVLPAGERIPIGYTERDVSDNPGGAHKQRPFADAPDDLNANERASLRCDVMFPQASDDA